MFSYLKSIQCRLAGKTILWRWRLHRRGIEAEFPGQVRSKIWDLGFRNWDLVFVHAESPPGEKKQFLGFQKSLMTVSKNNKNLLRDFHSLPKDCQMKNADCILFIPDDPKGTPRLNPPRRNRGMTVHRKNLSFKIK
jgi:hypothetical protein